MVWTSDVRVAVIDTGVNESHPHVGKIAGGASFRVKEDLVVREAEFRDYLGHGTAVTGIILAKAPTAKLYAIRVFERTLTTYPSLVAAAVYEALELGCKVINMSLSLSNTSHLTVLEEACNEAHSQGCLIVAAADREEKPSWPADWPMVLKVYGAEACAWDEVIIKEKPMLSLAAHSYPRPLPGRPQRQNLNGNSFACAHVSGIAAALLTGDKEEGDYLALNKLLA